MTKKPTYSIHVPCEQYGFIAGEGFETPEAADEAYSAVQFIVQHGDGLPEKEWKAFLDLYLADKKIPEGTELWAQMNSVQKWMVNEVKKTKDRINPNK